MTKKQSIRFRRDLPTNLFKLFFYRPLCTTMKRVQIYLSKSQEAKVKELTGKDKFTGVDVVELIMKM